jgi:cytochrome P450
MPDPAEAPPAPAFEHPSPEPDFMEDPSLDSHPRYARLRAECPVPRLVGVNGVQRFVVTRYEDAKSAFTDPRLSRNARYAERTLAEAGMGAMLDDDVAAANHNMLSADPPDHTRLRRIVAAEFTPRRCETLRPRVQELADELISAFEGTGRTEFMHDFANPLPALVIAELLGVPREDQRRFRAISNDYMRPWGDPRQAEASAALAAYLAQQIQAKRERPGDDLLSDLVSSRAEDRLTEDELRGTALLLLVAGHETTANLIGNGLLALLQHPDQYALLRERPELIPEAVEEFLRYDSPVERSPDRYSVQDMEIGGTFIPAGSVVQVGISSANRDEAAFKDADTLDVTRAPRGHVAFGYGIHFCLGAPLARVEAQIAFATLLRRLPDLQLAVPAETLTHRQTSIIRALDTLPLTFNPRR